MRCWHFEVICGEMISEMGLLVAVLALVSGSTQTGGQSSPPSPTLAALQSHAGGSADPGSAMFQRTETSAGATSEPETTAAYSWTAASAAGAPPPTHAQMDTISSPPTSAATPSSTPTLEPSTPPQLTPDPLATFSPPPVHVEQDARVTASAFLSQHGRPTVSSPLTTTERPLTPAAGRDPTPPTLPEVPAQLNVGDEDIKPHHRSSSPLDPLLAGLLSVFIVTTAIVFITLFFRFRQRTNHPEFHRLQDLPMDDLMEDTPLSRYTY